MMTRSWIRRLFARPVTGTIRKAPHRAGPALEALEDRCVPSTFVVDNPTDTPVAGETDLRQAITLANSTTGANTIAFDSTVFNTPQTITLTGSQLELSNTSGTETITGPAAGVTVNGNNASRVFQVDANVTASISGLTITGGNSASNGGGVNNYGSLTLTNCTVSGNSASGGSGGGLDNYGGTLALINCTVSGNHADNGGSGGGLYTGYAGRTTLTNCTVSGNSAGSGGGLYNFGTLALTNCTVSGNSASTGGGLDNNYGGTATLTNCTVSGNSALNGGSGGGLYNAYGGTATLTSCTVSGNSADNGGGLYNFDTLALTNCTVSGNSALNGGAGGGLDNYGGTTTLTNCTVSGNSASGGSGGGLYNYGGTTTLTNTIVAGNTASTGPDARGTFASQGNNLIGKTNGSSGWVGSDLKGTNAQPLNPLLAPLGNNGGPTQTMALLPGSPALNAGDPALLGAADQRGVVRRGGVNIGAYQASASAFVLSAPAAATAGAPFDLTVTAVDAFGQTAVGYSGTVHFTGSDPQAVLPADATLTNGTGTFTATLYSAGSQTVTATDAADGSITGFATVAVNPAAASHLVLRYSANPVNGRAWSVTVTAYDAFGNMATGYTGTVHFASSDSRAALPRDYTFTAADAGTHTFSVTFRRLGQQSLTVTDTLDASLFGMIAVRVQNPGQDGQ